MEAVRAHGLQQAEEKARRAEEARKRDATEAAACNQARQAAKETQDAGKANAVQQEERQASAASGGPKASSVRVAPGALEEEKQCRASLKAAEVSPSGQSH
jgi:hypothetical protein